MTYTVPKTSSSNTVVMELFFSSAHTHMHTYVCVPHVMNLGVLYMETELESSLPACSRCCEIKNSPPPGGKAELSGVRGHRRRSGHTRVRTLFTTGEAHLRPPTTVLPAQYCTSAGGAALQSPLGGSKAQQTASSYHDMLLPSIMR